ncbi:MAG: phosphatidate cytidylyltransferase [Bacteroidia bacterium]
MNNLQIRAITGAVYLLMIISSILIGIWAFLLVILLFSVLGIYEFYNLYKSYNYDPQIIFGSITGAFVTAAIPLLHWGYISFNILLLVIPAFIIMCIAELYRKKENPIINLSITLMGIVYISLSLGLLGAMLTMDGYWIVLGIFLLIWSNDTFAYLIGSRIGRKRLFSRISPKKSVEGSIGGFVMTLGVAALIGLFSQSLLMIHWVTLGIIIVLTATFGDLFESMMKRSLGIKDTGNILPGHGGILDRFDSVLMTAPVVYVYVRMVLQ